MYGQFVSHVPSALLLFVLAAIFFACSRRPKVGLSAPNNRRAEASATGVESRVVGHALTPNTSISADELGPPRQKAVRR